LLFKNSEMMQSIICSQEQNYQRKLKFRITLRRVNKRECYMWYTVCNSYFGRMRRL